MDAENPHKIDFISLSYTPTLMCRLVMSSEDKKTQTITVILYGLHNETPLLYFNVADSVATKLLKAYRNAAQVYVCH